MKVAAIQMVSSTDLAANLAHARALLARAAEAGAELAVLPEYFCIMGRVDTDKLQVQEPFGDGPIQRFLSEAAREFRLWLVGGTLPITADGGRVRNSSLAFEPGGACVARYDKIHLFRFDNGVERFDEARVLEHGTTPQMFEMTARDGRLWRIGMSVCYDLRFPELYRDYAARGADLLLVPSAFTQATGLAHWELLLRTRAVENLAFVMAPAQGGLHESGRRTWGHSMLVDPWGQVLAEHAEGEAVVLAELDAARLETCRTQLPALGHRVL
ncbi:acyltransferase [Rhodoferax koreense]|uniref:Acyltransferase n=1 Tax=Rhodoferax koreensis TaxID=1842727 RepID=A0A1P8K2L9_9BURK|nr:carbon-nitrogen hydrolase family protein [Rhodoferax koreense]APW40258.1 acyltransferase [Rhodoferax koreense]